MTNDADIAAQLRQLTDRSEIQDCMMRYARGMDRRDRALLRSAYHDDGVDDHVGFVGGVEDFIDWAFAYHSTQTRYQHFLMNHTVELNGDEAHAETYYLFVGTDREPANHTTASGGRYVDRLERRDNQWAIVDRVCVVEWITDSESLLTEEIVALTAAAGIKGPAHGRDDPSYQRPLVATRARDA